MPFLLAFETARAFLQGNSRVAGHVARHQGEIHLAAISVFELERWLVRSRLPTSYNQAYYTLWQTSVLEPLTDEMAHRGAMLSIHGVGRKLTTLALLTAATAVVGKLTLVSRRVQMYSALPGLALVDWTAP